MAMFDVKITRFKESGKYYDSQKRRYDVNWLLLRNPGDGPPAGCIPDLTMLLEKVRRDFSNDLDSGFSLLVEPFQYMCEFEPAVPYLLRKRDR